jgi:ABC-type sugar transport system ATPase subunit
VIDGNPARAGANLIRGTVEVVEPQGATTILQMSIGQDKKILALVNEQWGREPGEKLTLTVESELIHVFDPKTDESISALSAAEK